MTNSPDNAQPAAPQGVAYAELADERAAFEAWIKKDCGDLSTFGSGQNIHYSNSAVNNAWTGWKARASHGKTPAGAVPDEQMIAEYGIKASRMMARDLTRFDAACEVDKHLREQGAPGYYRHRMSIILFGNVEGTEASRAPENSEPTLTAQADSESFERRLQAIAIDRDYWREQAQKADSVLEDAARWKFVESAPSAITLRLHNLRPDQREQYVDAARKQGAKHD